jgi:CubicO group peptidase (beta-lactamase class C family)
MLLNGGELDGVRILEEDTVEAMTIDQIDSSLRATFFESKLTDRFGYGFTMYSSNDSIHRQLHSAYAWFGMWNTQFRVSPKGDWILITMSQLVTNEEGRKHFAEFERIAAESIVELPKAKPEDADESLGN